ncbi:MAG TPA: hypothetical protein VEC99_03785 [Clostridia bacterium]|nr:hypothetical protein [Clostridia bacterium]
MQKPKPILVRFLTPWRLVSLGLLSWPLCLGLLIVSAHLHLPTELAVFLAVTTVFSGLACALMAVHMRQLSFFREVALLVLAGGIWACIGGITLYVMRSGVL